MFVPANCGVILLSVFALSTPIAGDPKMSIVFTSVNVTHNPNDYIDSWTMEVVGGKSSSRINAKIPVKKDLPNNLQVEYVITMKGEDPIEYSSSLCESFEEDIVVKSFVSAGIPKGEFPTKCPIKAGDWSVEKWDPPLDIVPPGIPEGQFTGYLMYVEEGKKPYVKIDIEGVLSYV